MRINLKTTNIPLTRSMEDVIKRKMEPLTKILLKKLSPDSVLSIEVGRATRHHEKGKVFFAEARAALGGHEIYAHKEAEDIYKAADMVATDCKRQYIEMKDRLITLQRRGSRDAKNMEFKSVLTSED